MTGRPARVGDELEARVGAVAHGGHCVARVDGRVVFVRHALPGELVRVVVTEAPRHGRFLRADATTVLEASPDRVEPPCPHAGAGRCGGCDWQHAALPAQRRLKSSVLQDALRHQGGISEVGGAPVAQSVDVVAVSGDQDGLAWRTRVRHAVDPNGRVGFFRHRSRVVEPVTGCRIATGATTGVGVVALTWPHVREVAVVASSAGDRLVAVQPPMDRDAARERSRALPGDVAVAGVRGRSWVTELAADRRWRVGGDGFWQVHPGAADTLVRTVRELLAPRPGEHLFDLYSGVGLFAGALAQDLGPTGLVDAVEMSERAVADARRNLHDLPTVRLHRSDVGAWLASGAVADADLVVLDPTRQGAGEAVMGAVLDRSPRGVAYVACDPVALARDLRVATSRGWTVAAVRGLDLFPMTHHLEAVALVLPPA